MSSAVEPPGILQREQVDALLSEAVAAAEQPAIKGALAWRFTGWEIELLAGLPPVSDLRHRPMLLGCGAVLLNLRILMRGLGVQPTVRILPDPGRLDLIATVRSEHPRQVADNDRALVGAVLSRADSAANAGSPLPRAVGEWVDPPTPSPDSLISPLRRAAKTEQAWVAVQPLPIVLAAAPSIAGGAETSGTALIVGTVLDGRGARLQAGQAAQRVTLTAAALGAATSHLDELLQPEGNRRRVRELIGGALWPQAILRLDSDLLSVSG